MKKTFLVRIGSIILLAVCCDQWQDAAGYPKDSNIGLWILLGLVAAINLNAASIAMWRE